MTTPAHLGGGSRVGIRISSLIDSKFGKLRVLSLNRSDGQRWWNCRCDCGRVVVATTAKLRYGHVKSCGCVRAEKISKYQSSKTHCPKGHEYDADNTRRRPGAISARRCLKCERESAVRKREKSYVHRRNRMLIKDYGMTLSGFDDLLKSQGGVCAICRISDGDCVDHDHLTGKVRGILCLKCNSGLGMFRDSAPILETAIGYLKKYS